MKKLFLAGSIVAALFILNSSAVQAQVVTIGDGNPIPAAGGSATPTATVTTEITPVLDLAVTSGQTVDFNFSTIATLDAGIEHDAAVSLTFRSNQPWFVNVAANTGNFTGGDVTSPMPASVLQYRLGGSSTFIPLSTTANSVTGTTGAKNIRGAGTIGVDYLMNPRYNYGPGNYSVVLTYTISNL